MGFFDRRTDTEKELDTYKKSRTINERQNQHNYGNENYNNFYDNTNQNKNDYFKPDISANNISNTPKNQNQKGGWGFGSTLLFLWFLISVAAFIVLTAMGQTNWGMIVFGQVFLVLGIMLCCKKDKDKKGKLSNLLNFIVTAVGAGIILVCLLYMFADEWLINSFNNNIVSVLVCSIFLVVGLIMLYFGIVKLIKDKARCTVFVDSEIIDIKRRLSTDEDGSSWVYAPVYRYYYQGQLYTGCSDIYSSSVARVGTQHKLRINPDNPNDFIEPKRMGTISALFIIMGVAFAGAGIMAIAAVISAG